jgi:hypothetical protein
MRKRNRRRKELSSAEEKVKFIKHLTSFVIVNVMMLLINALSGTIRNWLPVILFWGIGLAFHFVKAYGIGQSGIGSKDWEKKMLKKGKREEYEDDEFLDLKEIEKEPRKNWKEEDLV